jgi:hypothetical protein
MPKHGSLKRTDEVVALDLPGDIAAHVALHVPSACDVVAMAGVDHAWHTVLLGDAAQCVWRRLLGIRYPHMIKVLQQIGGSSSHCTFLELYRRQVHEVSAVAWPPLRAGTLTGYVFSLQISFEGAPVFAWAGRVADADASVRAPLWGNGSPRLEEDLPVAMTDLLASFDAFRPDPQNWMNWYRSELRRLGAKFSVEIYVTRADMACVRLQRSDSDAERRCWSVSVDDFVLRNTSVISCYAAPLPVVLPLTKRRLQYDIEWAHRVTAIISRNGQLVVHFTKTRSRIRGDDLPHHHPLPLPAPLHLHREELLQYLHSFAAPPRGRR